MATYLPEQDCYAFESELIDGTTTLFVGRSAFLLGIIGLCFTTTGRVVASGSLSLRWHSGAGPATVQAWLVPSTSPALYDQTLERLPGIRGEVLLAEAALVNPGDTALVLGETPIPANVTTCLDSMVLLRSISADPLWSHRFAITIRVTPEVPLEFEASEGGVSAPILTLVEREATIGSSPRRSKFAPLIPTQGIQRPRRQSARRR